MTKCKRCGKKTGPAFGLCAECIAQEDREYSPLYPSFPADSEYVMTRMEYYPEKKN